jgi:4-amino-4-deoxy-L-arabinose transferase-like glycosyltransferase
MAVTELPITQTDKTWVDNPVGVLVFLCVLQMATWTLAPGLTHHAPPLDVVESYLWGREWVAATFKHPNLPGWLLETSYLLTGAVGWPAYLLSQIMIVASFALVFLLGGDLFGADLRGSQMALAGVLLLTGIYYYSLSTPEFNHNVSQMPFFVAVILGLWRGVTCGGPVWWVVLGFAAAVGIQAKYSFGVLLAVAAGWLLLEPRARRCLTGAGPWIALAIFLIGAAPQVIWVIESGFLPLQYAERRANGVHTGNAFQFLLTQLADHAGLFVLAAAAGLLAMPSRLRKPKFVMGGLDPFAARFLLTFALGPVLLSAFLAFLSGKGVKDMWATPMFSLSGLLLVALTAERFTPAVLRRLAIGASALLVIVAAGYAASVLAGGHSNKALKVQWPQAEMSSRFEEIFRAETNRPLQIVAGDIWTAGVVALTAPGKPSIYTDADPDRAQWITQERLAEGGALAVWQLKGDQPLPELLAKFIGTAPRKEITFVWPDSASRPPLRIGYAVVPPTVVDGAISGR